MEKGRGTRIFVLGLLGIICCQFLGIPAWVMGSGDLKRIERGEIHPDAKTFTQIGMILGIIATALLILGAIWGMFLGGLATLLALFGLGG